MSARSPFATLRISTCYLLLMSLLNACGNDREDPAVQEYARAATPSDVELAGIYERSCRSCHAQSGTGAPLTGDAQSWEALKEDKGMDALVRNTIEGYGGMPPMGHCADCGRSEFKQLIRFMAEPPEDAEQESEA